MDMAVICAEEWLMSKKSPDHGEADVEQGYGHRKQRRCHA